MIVAARNLGAKAWRRLGAAHKPFVRLMRRAGRAREQGALAEDAFRIQREIAAIAAGRSPIVAGPWLAEVGYEALYWVPFLRWFTDAYRIPPERLTVVSRGGVDAWYCDIAAHYVDMFDHVTPLELASRNDERQRREEGGGRKQSATGSLDDEILSMVHRGEARDDRSVLHPSLLFRLFRNVWQGNLPLDLLWTHTDYVALEPPPRPSIASLPADYIAVKFYTGSALPDTAGNRDAIRAIVHRAARLAPVVVLDTGLAIDDHVDYLFADIPNVISARSWMTPRNNLGLQTALIAHARCFIGTCGGLAWLAPFLRRPTVAVYADDRQLAPHLLIARLANRRVGAAELSLLDLRALDRLDIVTSQGLCP